MEDVSLDVLASSLFRDIRADKNFFETKYVIVPSSKMESYLKAFYLKNNSSVLMNVNIMTFNKAILKLFNINYDLADRNQIRSIIIKYLNENKNSLDVEELTTYLKSDNYEIKLFDMASELTSLFADLEKDNALNKLEDWEKNIYNYVLSKLKDNNLITLAELLNDLQVLNKRVYVFGFVHYSKIEEEILKKLNNKFEYKLDIKNTSERKIDIVRAPSKIREIEYVHSKICELLLKEEEDNKFSDFLVVSTNMSDYEDVIARVFNQDDIYYPNIPYYINAPKVKNNNVYNVLRTIKEIIYKGFFSRLDFDNLINNKAIMYVRGISETDIESWRETINNINVYYTDEEWDYAIKRVLISKITGINDDDNIVTLGDNDFVPYTNISLDDNSIVRFVEMIDDINNIIEVFDSSKELLDNEWLDSFKEALDRFLSIKDSNDLETNGYYKKVSDVFEYWNNNKIINVPKKTFLETLIDVSKRSVTNKGELYTSGISFTEFDKNTILSAKYIFFINASSANLPIKKNKNSLNNDQIISYKEEQETFNAYYNNCEQMYISFVYKDLVKDEEFFLSNFVKELKDIKIDEISKKDKENKFKEENLDTIHIDEDGKVINKIFTRRGKKNKEFRKKLLNSDLVQEEIRESVDLTEQVKTNVVTTSQLGKFLYEPLSNKAERLFGSEDDVRDELEKEYSPFDLDVLDNYKLFKEVFIEIFNAVDKDEKKKELHDKFNLLCQLPNITTGINNKVFNEIIENYEKLVKNINKSNIIDSKIVKLDDINLITLTQNEWVLKNNEEFVRTIDGDNTRTYIPIKSGIISDKDTLVMFSDALMDIFSLPDGEYIIKLPRIKKPITISRTKAVETLNKIYESFIKYTDNYFMPYKLLGSDDNGNSRINIALPTIYELILKCLGYKGVWDYFKDRKLFDYITELGYNEDNYHNEIFESKNKQERLMDIIFKKTESEVNNDGNI